MRYLQSSWCPVCLGIIVTLVILGSVLSSHSGKPLIKSSQSVIYRENEEWVAPGENEIPSGREGDLIRYGKDLITNTSKYLGPKGIVSTSANGMNCQNCHINAGTQNFGNPFSNVLNSYPKYRDRSGKIETTVFRVNECMQRSMNGEELDSMSLEMRAFVAYLNWVGKDVPKSLKPMGTGAGPLPFMSRAADPEKGKSVFTVHCVRCHGEDGQGVMLADSTAYVYPPLWGKNSYNVSAGLYRLSNLAAFIKNNMPYGITYKNPRLTNEEAWDVAAYLSSQSRPEKFFAYDWPDLKKKPVDYPFGPFADGFDEKRHRYGPFIGMRK